MKKTNHQRRQALCARQGKQSRPAKSQHTVFRQMCNLIPGHMLPVLASQYKIDARGFSATSHVLSLLYGHASHALSLNEICDALSVHQADFLRIRGASAPARNTFSNANRTRDPAMAEALYWQMLKHLQDASPGFTEYGKHSGFIFRLKREIFAIDSTTLQLTLASIDWARHRRRKAAAKCHMRMNIGSFLPAFAVVDKSGHDAVPSELLCAGMGTGDVLLADRAYVKFPLLAALNERGVFFVLRSKQNMVYTTVKSLPAKGKILRDELIRTEGQTSATAYPQVLRMVTALVEVDGVECEMTFITNNTVWSARTIVELYRARWAIESFFKELKQTLQLRDFVGTNEKAVKWQVWIGLLTHLLLRFLRHLSHWGRSFSRCVGIVRSALWVKADLRELLICYGTAQGSHRPILSAKDPFLPGFGPCSSFLMGQHG